MTIKSIYKYLGPEVIDKIFQSPNNVTFKCSLPKDFNDPYELFLTIDFKQEPDLLAYYADAIGELPQYPTTCFSRSPAVIPMWAHYAQNHEGFVIEVSEERLSEKLPEVACGDVSYSDVPPRDLSALLGMAYGTSKMRHTYLLRQGVLHSAYFTKTSCWAYEQERRLVVPEKNTREIGTTRLFDVPNECVTSIICGSRASEATRLSLMNKAQEMSCRYFELRIGKNSATPFFLDAAEQPFVFNMGELAQCDQHCGTCMEPIAQEADECSWCQINDQLRIDAASRNPFRVLDRLGMLESYVAGMDAISAGSRKT
ncbi:MAG TPA: DUF2971 domain-containing protein [Bradyrhizobium sp.]|uniref:DUF2971 domain-containing protein n=1 Tax=Bradyrhizobium sp. TaxID=376 RepID=UPI002CECE71D|nr:DUF2971 domain-containing protein [Bradyrhizobium sp.]HLZ00750.1 DUF2971 domain-containing protein [Bradyrhizobium sp.]